VVVEHLGEAKVAGGGGGVPRPTHSSASTKAQGPQGFREESASIRAFRNLCAVGNGTHGRQEVLVPLRGM
jgi:hypothetical protein